MMMQRNMTKVIVKVRNRITEQRFFIRKTRQTKQSFSWIMIGTVPTKFENG